jgi:hypothetical protein
MRAIGYSVLRSLVKRLIGDRGGNAMLFVALGLPVLVGAAGYGTDMAQLYMWKRELQHSVDQAALAGAYALADNPDSDNYETRARQEFDANQDRTADYASDPTVTLRSYDGGSDNSVVVSASVTRRLPFSGFLVNKSMFVQASAQASFSHGATYKACLMALKKDAGGTFTVGGNATVNAACGLGALSCEEDAITVGGSATVHTDSIVACGTVDVPSNLQSKVTEHATVSNPFEDLPAPKPTDNTGKTFSCPKKGAANLSPGRYVGGINAKCDITFASGIYVIDGGTLDLTDQKAAVNGTKVMFVLKNGATISLGGQGNSGTINLSPMEAGDFTGDNAQYADMYAGMLVYEDATGQTSATSHKLNGNASISVRGTIYLPNGNVTVNGNSSTTPLCFQIWSNTIAISGSTVLSTTCTSSQTNNAGSQAGGVKLVA